jgi:arylsulfatase A-like enzyme
MCGVSATKIFSGSQQGAKEGAGPFFAVIQTADNHRPYTIPEEDRQGFSSGDGTGRFASRYGFGSNEEMNAFRYTDFGYRTFIEAASKEKYFANTIFLFVGDHGIPGDAGALFPRAWTDQRLTAEHVPLLIWSPVTAASAADLRVSARRWMFCRRWRGCAGCLTGIRRLDGTCWIRRLCR